MTMNENLTYEAIEKARASLGSTGLLGGVSVRTSTHLREQFRFPRTKKRRIRRKWAKRSKNWRAITNRAFQMPDGSIVCHPVFAAKLRQHLAT